MWRLLPLYLSLGLLTACAANDAKTSTDDSDATPAPAGIVRTTDLPLGASAVMVEGRTSNRIFQSSGISGWIDSAGVWQLRSEVPHSRLRCATYEVGMQLGSGDPGCSRVRWLTNVEYVTRETQCNSATRIHSGRGSLSNADQQLEAASCVRIVVHCEGAC